MTTTEKMATFTCTHCNLPRPYGDNCADRRVHPWIYCGFCRNVTRHQFVTVEDYTVTSYGGVGMTIMKITFQRGGMTFPPVAEPILPTATA